MKLQKSILNAVMIVAAVLLLVPTAIADGGDFSLDFIAAAPFTYDHSTGGGAYNDRDIGKYDDAVESLEGGDFICYDTVTYFVAVTVAAQPVQANQTIEMQFSFLAATTGQPGAAHEDITYVGINYGNVENGGGGGLGSFAPDTGIVDDGGSTAAIISKEFTPIGTSPFAGADELILVIQVDDLEAGEQVIVRIDTLLDCLPGTRPTGNLQGQLNSARVVKADGQVFDDAVPGGEQTVPFKQIGDLPPPNPTAVELVSFTATADARAIVVAWETASEVDNLGFNLYRGESPDGVRVKLNRSLIASQFPGSPVGAAYEFVDGLVQRGITYYYWLDAVDVSGSAATYGPVSAQVANVLTLGLPGRPRPAPGSIVVDLGLITAP
jgi:hypothetical protein